VALKSCVSNSKFYEFILWRQPFHKHELLIKYKMVCMASKIEYFSKYGWAFDNFVNMNSHFKSKSRSSFFRICQLLLISTASPCVVLYFKNYFCNLHFLGLKFFLVEQDTIVYQIYCKMGDTTSLLYYSTFGH